MNLFKKIYCRCYQTAFRAVLPILPYRSPKKLSSISELIQLLQEKQMQSILLVTDASLRSLEITKPLEQGCKEKGIQCIVYDQTVANPTTDNVEEVLSLYHTHDCQALIGFGGGSSIDCAKAVGARIAQPKKTLGQMKGILKIHRRLPLLFAIPTTAGTGSETTLASVITDAKTREKYPINDFPLIPHYAILDASLTCSLPPMLTATTGLDALTHAIEAYIGRSTTRKTRKDSLDAIQLIFDNLEEAVNHGQNLEARKNMLLASFLAGRAFTQSYVGYVHAIAHSLGGKYNIPHGLANAVLLPIVLKTYGASAHKKLYEIACILNLADENDSMEQGANCLIEAIEQMERRLNIPTYLEGIQDKDIPALAALADKEANPLYPVPMLMDANELVPLYYLVKKGENDETRRNQCTDQQTKNIFSNWRNTFSFHTN